MAANAPGDVAVEDPVAVVVLGGALLRDRLQLLRVTHARHLLHGDRQRVLAAADVEDDLLVHLEERHAERADAVVVHVPVRRQLRVVVVEVALHVLQVRFHARVGVAGLVLLRARPVAVGLRADAEANRLVVVPAGVHRARELVRDRARARRGHLRDRRLQRLLLDAQRRAHALGGVVVELAAVRAHVDLHVQEVVRERAVEQRQADLGLADAAKEGDRAGLAVHVDVQEAEALQDVHADDDARAVAFRP